MRVFGISYLQIYLHGLPYQFIVGWTGPPSGKLGHYLTSVVFGKIYTKLIHFEQWGRDSSVLREGPMGPEPRGPLN